jgi:hypothetical protein
VAASPDAPPEDFLRFTQMVAREMHSRVDEPSMRRVPDTPEQASLYSFMEMAMPDAHDPRTSSSPTHPGRGCVPVGGQGQA